MKKKVLIFHPYLATYRVDLYNRLAKDFIVRVLLTGAQKELDALGFDLSLVNAQAEFEYKYYNKSIYLGRHPISTIFWREIYQFKPDIVIAHEYGLNTLASIFAKPFSQFKLFLTCDDNVQMAQEYSKWRTCLRNFIVKKVDGFITVSQSTLLYLQNLYPSQKDKFILFPIIQDDTILTKKIIGSSFIAESYIEKYNLKNQHVILFVGRLEPVKCVDMLIKAFSNVLVDDVKLVLVGNGSLFMELNTLVRNLGLDNKVVFTGSLTGSELYAWFYIAKTFVLASNHEAFGAVVNEALVGGCRCIVSDHCGSYTLINSANGQVFKSGNIVELQQCISIEVKSAFDKHHVSLMPRSFNNYYEILYKRINFM